MILSITKERAEKVAEIITSVNRKEPIWKQVHKVAEAYKVFGIQMVWNGRKRTAYFSIGCKDAYGWGNGNVFTGYNMTASPFSYVRDCVIELVTSFRLGYADYHRNHPKQLKLIERISNI